jgi:hypothetical protein
MQLAHQVALNALAGAMSRPSNGAAGWSDNARRHERLAGIEPDVDGAVWTDNGFDRVALKPPMRASGRNHGETYEPAAGTDRSGSRISRRGGVKAGAVLTAIAAHPSGRATAHAKLDRPRKFPCRPLSSSRSTSISAKRHVVKTCLRGSPSRGWPIEVLAARWFESAIPHRPTK